MYASWGNVQYHWLAKAIFSGTFVCCSFKTDLFPNLPWRVTYRPTLHGGQGQWWNARTRPWCHGISFRHFDCRFVNEASSTLQFAFTWRCRCFLLDGMCPQQTCSPQRLVKRVLPFADKFQDCSGCFVRLNLLSCQVTERVNHTLDATKNEHRGWWTWPRETSKYIKCSTRYPTRKGYT